MAVFDCALDFSWPTAVT
ncbi:hypothetical protein AN5605.2 [Aspergillus nidulans FGSC A4]|nr:hypothetical protein AN5605.2 [Aspergillus nidulans FGSC A4]